MGQHCPIHIPLAEVGIIMGTLPLALVGGMISATVLALVVIPAVFLIWKRRTTQSDA